jgi:F-type H+-transporting ATPase subunit b
MNIPLNIDWQQILLHLFNFAILAVGLYLLLYKPVKNFMDKRSAYYTKLDEDAKSMQKNAEQSYAEYQEKLFTANQEIANKKKVAQVELEQLRKDKVAEAEQEAEQILTESRKRAEVEKQKLIADAQSELVAVAMLAAKKLAKANIPDDCNQTLLEDVINKVGENSGNEYSE